MPGSRIFVFITLSPATSTTDAGAQMCKYLFGFQLCFVFFLFSFVSISFSGQCLVIRHITCIVHSNIVCHAISVGFLAFSCAHVFASRPLILLFKFIFIVILFFYFFFVRASMSFARIPSSCSAVNQTGRSTYRFLSLSFPLFFSFRLYLRRCSRVFLCLCVSERVRAHRDLRITMIHERVPCIYRQPRTSLRLKVKKCFCRVARGRNGMARRRSRRRMKKEQEEQEVKKKKEE